MQDLTLYYLFLKYNLMRYYFDKILSFAKSGCYIAPQNRQREVGAGHTLRSSNLLGVEASLARVSQSCLKTGGSVTARGVCGTIAEVASEAS
jgi:hypothetical protein